MKWLALVLGVAGIILGGATSAADDPFQMISVDEVAKLLGKPDVHIYDANSEKVFLEGHVPGAKHVSNKADFGALLPPKKEAALIFYCKNTH